MSASLTAYFGDSKFAKFIMPFFFDIVICFLTLFILFVYFLRFVKILSETFTYFDFPNKVRLFKKF